VGIPEEVNEIDKHLVFLATEIKSLEGRSESWAKRKADALERIRNTLTRYRRGLQMTGIGGRRIDE
jgi:hypothetical protein